MIDKVAGINAKGLIAEYRRLQMGIAECELYAELIKAVMWRESSDQVFQDKVIIKDRANDFGGDAHLMYQGWAQLIKVFRNINHSTLDATQTRTLENTERMLLSLGQQFSEVLEKGPAAVPQKTSEVIASLKIFNEIYINTGHSKHHIVVRYSLENGVYYRTEYNAGHGAQPTNDPVTYYDAIVDGARVKKPIRNVWAINKQPIKNGKLREMVALDMHNTFAASPISQEKRAEYLDATVQEESLKSAPQVLGTCSSRSTSLLLTERLRATNIFGNLYILICSNDFDGIKNALEFRRNEIIQDLDKAGIQADPEVLQLNIEPLLRKYKNVIGYKAMPHRDNWLDVFSEAIVRHIEAIRGKELPLTQVRQLKEEITKAYCESSMDELMLSYTSLKNISFVAFGIAKNILNQNTSRGDDLIIAPSSLKKIFSETKTFLMQRAVNYGDEFGAEFVLTLGACQLADGLISKGLVADLGYGGYVKARIIDEIKPILARVAQVYHYDVQTMQAVLNHTMVSLQSTMKSNNSKIPSLGSEEFITVIVNACKRLANDKEMFFKKSRHSVFLNPINNAGSAVAHYNHLIENKNSIQKNMSASKEENLKTLIALVMQTPEYVAFLNLNSEVIGNSHGSIGVEAFKLALENHGRKPLDKVVPEVLKEVYKQVKVMTVSIPEKKPETKSTVEEKKPAKEENAIIKAFGPNPLVSLVTKKVSKDAVGYMVAYGDIHPKHKVSFISQVFEKNLHRIDLAGTIINASVDKSFLSDPAIAKAIKAIPAERVSKLSEVNKKSFDVVKTEIEKAVKVKASYSTCQKVALGLAFAPVLPSCVYFGLCTASTAATIACGAVVFKCVIAIPQLVNNCRSKPSQQGVSLPH